MYYVENYPEIKNNYYLGARGVGASRKLRGDIGVIVCFMRKRPTDFPEDTRNEFFEELNKFGSWLEKLAKGYGTDLDFHTYYFEIDIPADSDPHKGYGLIRKFFNVENQNIDYLQNHYEKRLNVNEAPFILVFDENARSFAKKQSTASDSANEYSVVFKDNGHFRWTTIGHELLHQFGALDYYYPKEITEQAEFYFEDSIMGIGRNDKLDDLTAYIVGLKDTISASSYGFLKNTMWMNGELRRKAIEAAWKNDNGAILKNTTASTAKADDTQLNFTTVYAKFFGSILSMPIWLGKNVKANDIICIIQGSYGVIPVFAGVAGRIDKLYIKPGEKVKDGTLLAVISKY